MREAHRLLAAGPAQTLARLLEVEVGAKLEQPVVLDLSPAQAVDLKGYGRAVASLVGAGVPLDQALKLAGLDESNSLTPGLE